MSVEGKFAHFLKPEVRKRGRDEFTADQAFISAASDSQIQGYVKAMPPLRVVLRTEDIASSCFTADCNCAAANKGNLCKHIWAIILLTESQHPDFLENKTTLEKASSNISGTESDSPYKAKQAAYQKAQYQKQKQWAKDRKVALKKKDQPQATRPPEVAAALDFFDENGFPMPDGPDIETLQKAKKILARIFHPDKGGTHAEAVILNQHFETLINFLN